MMYSIQKIVLYAVVLTLCCACNSGTPNMQQYIAVYKGDTALLSIHVEERSFYGKLHIIKSMTKDEKGDVRGKVLGDILEGDYVYTPFKNKLQKRRPLVFKRVNNTLVQGFGLEHIYMGIPYFSPGSIHFDNPKYVFHAVHLD